MLEASDDAQKEIPDAPNFNMDHCDACNQKPKVVRTTAKAIHKVTYQVKAMTRKLATKMRRERIEILRAKINGSDMQSDQQLFKHLRQRNGTPTASLRDHSTRKQSLISVNGLNA